ncbi:uncharacterized protein LOC136771835 [Amia ocellicauda]|uniref:uncharacterized protein LOC136771835 n=1 Tax=Amia ocellicauda TaxID=2972642 RepID=UPI003464B487
MEQLCSVLVAVVCVMLVIDDGTMYHLQQCMHQLTRSLGHLYLATVTLRSTLSQLGLSVLLLCKTSYHLWCTMYYCNSTKQLRQSANEEIKYDKWRILDERAQREGKMAGSQLLLGLRSVAQAVVRLFQAPLVLGDSLYPLLEFVFYLCLSASHLLRAILFLLVASLRFCQKRMLWLCGREWREEFQQEPRPSWQVKRERWALTEGPLHN